MHKPIGVYLRLSDEDQNQNQSNSIITQRKLIKDYLSNHKELSLCPILEFVDDGYSGTNFNRPSITKLLQCVKYNQIWCIVVKDFSRFGRNYIEVGSYIEQIFPFLGVRFISVNDRYDSFNDANKSEFLTTAFKNLVCDLYSKDLSEKIVSVRRLKASQGKFITAFAPYGYHKSKDQQLVVDTQTAPIVKRIFNMALSGIPKVLIARTLNSEGIPSPLMVKKMRKDSFSCKHINQDCVWQSSTISTILKDRRYTGDAVYGKVKPTSIGSRASQPTAQKDWVIVPDKNEAIITKDLFEKIANTFTKHKSTHSKKTYPLSEKVICGGCNHTISPPSNNKPNRNYSCSMLAFTNQFGCYSGSISEEKLEQAILTYLNQIGSVFLDENSSPTQEIDNSTLVKEQVRLIAEKERQLNSISAKKMQAYEAFKQHRLAKEKYLADKQKLDSLYTKLSLELKLHNQNLSDIDKKQLSPLQNNQQHPSFCKLTRKLCVDLIDKLIIHPNGYIEIVWLSSNIFTRLTPTETNFR